VIDFENEERRVLARARAVLAPSLADQERVRGALDGAIAATMATALHGASNGGETAVARSADAALWSTSLGKWLARLAIPMAAALGGGVGYELGHSAGLEQTRTTDALATAALPTEPPSPVTVAKTQTPPPARTAQSTRATPSRAAPPAPSAPPELAPDAGLDEEVRLLRRVERALREQNPRYALALLGELDRQVPRGQLVEERKAARVMASCQLGSGGDALAEKFASDHPGSAYIGRVRETCSAEKSGAEP
jgi:hypothetical protein